MSNGKRRFAAVGAACALVSVLAGCGSGSGSGGDYVIGVNDVLSGPLASYGQSFLTQAKGAVTYVNNHGGINGHKVNLVTADSAAVGQNASAAAQQLVNSQNVSAMLGFTLSDDCSAVSSIATSRKVPIICTSVPPDELTPVKKYVFAGNDIELQEIPGTVAFAQNELKLGPGTRFAILDANPLGVQLWAKKLTGELQAAGFTSVAHETIPATSVNGSTQIANVVAANPQVVFAEPVASQYLPLIQALRAAGNNAPVIAAHNGVGYTGLTTIKDPNLYSITTTEYLLDPAAPAGQGQQIYAEGMSATGQTTAATVNNTIGAPGFLSTYAVTQALAACGYPCSGAKLADAMESLKIDFPGVVSGTYGWTGQLHSPYSQFYVYGWDATAQKPKIAKEGVVSGPLA
ncbi:ABC transporter substrate-binding protein [Amycolatopsis sp.]|uniref:ABC transporter substrate-binding protein n=1 Tax=Amycolatopsis sp. TaxID=37632 RepID=UPI002BD1E6F4|nr:ABC transporter substrate-binding protein [Amycolatopsis sp.]HVV08122.1 ABC transporter substrate-binding protein [Amycolatopsis sp.]